MLQYRFVPGSMGNTIRAWRAFQRAEPETEQNRIESVDFIPASEGCFVVLQVEERPGWPGIWKRFVARHTGAMLDRFCRMLERH